MTATEPARPLRLTEPGELLALVPFLLGFHPADSLVVVGLRDRRVVCTLRLDLVPPGPAVPPASAGASARPRGRPPAGPPLAVGSAGWVVAVLAAQGLTDVVLVGYGPLEHVEPAGLELRGALDAAGLTVLDCLRVAGDRYWSAFCADPACCPVTGRSYEPVRARITERATAAGLSALPDRADLVARLGPVRGAAARGMERAAERAEARRDATLARRPDEPAAGVAALLAAGSAAVTTAIARYQTGDGPPDGALDDDEVAWLGVVLRQITVRDLAWRAADSGDPGSHRALWTDLVRRLPRRYVAAPATLLGYVCWQQGDGAFADVALSRARDADPSYELALLLSQVLAAGMPPATWRASADSDDRAEAGR